MAWLKQDVDSEQPLNQDLSVHLNTTKQRCLQQGEQLVRDHQAARRKLLDLSNQGDVTTRKLQEVISKVTLTPPSTASPPAAPLILLLLFQGEKVLRAAEQCHKLQSKLELPTKEHGQVRSRPTRPAPGPELLPGQNPRS